MIPGILRKTSALLAEIRCSYHPRCPRTTPAPAETRRLHVELTLEEAIRAAQEQSIAAMVAKYTFLSSYWSFRSFRASRLPSLNLSGEVLSFDRSLRLLQDYDTGEMRYLENYNLQNTIALSIPPRTSPSRAVPCNSTRRSAGWTVSPPKIRNPTTRSPLRSPTPSRSSPTTSSSGTRRSHPRSTSWPNAPTSRRWRT